MRGMRRRGWWPGALALLAVSCGDARTMTEPDVVQVDRGRPATAAANTKATSVPLLEWIGRPKDETNVTAFIGADGGVIATGGVELRIPAGALTQTTEIKMVVPGGRFVHVTLMPHGLQFRLPAQLSFDLTHTSGANLSAQLLLGAYFTEKVKPDGLIVPLETFDMIVQDKRASMWITHFSKYGPTRRGYTAAGA